MQPLTRPRSLDRHALVMALWLSFGLVAAALFDYGFGSGGALYLGGGFGVILAAFAGHVIVNAIHATGFSPRELAHGMVSFAVGLIAFVLAVLAGPDLGWQRLVALSSGFIAVFAAIVFYMITHYGVRRVFDAFDVVRDFRPDSRSEDRP